MEGREGTVACAVHGGPRGWRSRCLCRPVVRPRRCADFAERAAAGRPGRTAQVAGGGPRRGGPATHCGRRDGCHASTDCAGGEPGEGFNNRTVKRCSSSTDSGSMPFAARVSRIILFRTPIPRASKCPCRASGSFVRSTLGPDATSPLRRIQGVRWGPASPR